ncbi:T9SS C-terminal target domain-containing protein [Oopsacas minuta]|uniref:T9SS C-terminal target domain-containing protein n=1 Tax=Oopsacas minuta TaxID=111878 RepID=A0AAV7JJ66_9METZ|nr:T9SS C-terminal target domain-containing protein [Oopsacas minuta]
MAAVFNVDQKLEDLKMEIIRTFDELYQYLSDRRDSLLSRLANMKEGYDKNVELEEAIKQLRISKDQILATMTSNLVGGALDTVKQTLDRDIEVKIAEKVKVGNLEFIEFRCYSDKIRKTINEIDLFEIIPEYVRRENPILKVCKRGRGNGELNDPAGITVDRASNELYICEYHNSRIQVLTTEGKYLRSFGTDHLKEPYGICLSKEEVFVTDRAKESLVKFNLSGKFLKETGSRGNTEGRFTSISGLRHEAGLIYVCDFSIQRIQIFDSNLKFIKQFGYGELKAPTDITLFSDRIYILSQNNSIYCYNRDCTLQNIIQLTGQDQPMTAALFFTIDKKGNFLITDNAANDIRIFSPQGVMKHILGRGHLSFLNGIVLDNSDNIICVNNGIEGKGCFQKY